MNPQTKKRIEELINSKKVFLFMKGSPLFPACGFSSRVVHVLKKMNADFGSFNILEDEEIRQGIKEYANWPTIPQLYIDGEFVGGCDIVESMAQSGDLQKKLSA